jgi:hypothetical protein
LLEDKELTGRLFGFDPGVHWFPLELRQLPKTPLAGL